jgi:hypothetical protein
MSKSPVIFALIALAQAQVFAADASKEISTAAAHAGMAAGAADPQMVRAHLHHVLNCLEGPSGADFSAAAGNPCKDDGMGALTDATADHRKDLEQAVTIAKAGLAEPEINKAKTMASEAQTLLSK